MTSLQGIKDFYANQPVVHMSNQSVIYNSDGTVAKVINGTQVTASSATAVPTIVCDGSTDSQGKRDSNTGDSNASPDGSAAATKTQSPGFEMVLAAIGMLSALALITRKKK